MTSIRSSFDYATSYHILEFLDTSNLPTPSPLSIASRSGTSAAPLLSEGPHTSSAVRAVPAQATGFGTGAARSR